VRDSEAKFAQFRQPVALERFVSPVGYAHWSFDDPNGGVYRAQSFGLAGSAGNALHSSDRHRYRTTLKAVSAAALGFAAMPMRRPHFPESRKTRRTPCFSG
jgi:hypothetical protein